MGFPSIQLLRSILKIPHMRFTKQFRVIEPWGLTASLVTPHVKLGMKPQGAQGFLKWAVASENGDRRMDLSVIW